MGAVTAAEPDYIIARNPDSVLAPDIGFVRKDRILVSGRSVKFWPGAPDLAVEVLSPSDSALEVDEKTAEYLTAGTALVWVVNPKRRTVAIHRADRTVSLLSDGDVLDGEDVLPGFRFPVAEIFG